MPGSRLNSFGVEPSRIAGDDEALDLANSFTNVEDAGIAKPFFHEIVGCIPAWNCPAMGQFDAYALLNFRVF